VFLILIGAHIFSPFLAMSRIPVDLANALAAMALPTLAVLAILLVAYIILGMFLEGFAILVLTVPIVLPIMAAMSLDPIWFGIFMVIVLEMGLISPPVGINVFVVKGIAEDVPMYRIFAGILPFWIAMIVGVGLLVAFPQIALILPNTMIR
jgi:TRAP-type C4-dicarboxylate transport system permease large subunit